MTAKLMGLSIMREMGSSEPEIENICDIARNVTSWKRRNYDVLAGELQKLEAVEKVEEPEYD